MGSGAIFMLIVIGVLQISILQTCGRSTLIFCLFPSLKTFFFFWGGEVVGVGGVEVELYPCLVRGVHGPDDYKTLVLSSINFLDS